MKRFYIITILAVICGMTALAQNRPGIAHQTNGGDRIDFVTGSSPIIIYNGNSQTLTVNGNLFVTYFELTIKSMDTQEIVFQEEFEGHTATISVVDLIDGKMYQVEYADNRGTTYMMMFQKRPSWFDYGTGLNNSSLIRE